MNSKEAFNLQPAGQQHATAIRRLVARSGINPTGLDWQRFLVAVNEDGELVGCGQIKPHKDGSQELASIAVEKAWRNQGIATAIIQRLVAGHDGDLYLMCQSSLGSLYEEFGFYAIEENEMPTYFRRVSKLASVLDTLRRAGEHLLIMRRPGS